MAARTTNIEAASGEKVEGLLQSRRRATRSYSNASDRLEPDLPHADTLRKVNKFHDAKEKPNICFLTGYPMPSCELQMAHLLPHSETQKYDVVRMA
jgi:hypothetical protein